MFEKRYFVFVPADKQIGKVLIDSMELPRDRFRDYIEFEFVRLTFNSLRCAMINLDPDPSPTEEARLVRLHRCSN